MRRYMLLAAREPQRPDGLATGITIERCLNASVEEQPGKRLGFCRGFAQ